MKESWKNHKCGECALFGTDACYLVTYVDEESEACDELLQGGKDDRQQA